MDTNNINIIVFDEEDNFGRTKNLIGYEGDTVKRFFCIQSLNQFKNVLEQLGGDDLIILVVHVFGKTENLKGIAEFKASDIAEKFPRLEYMLVSEGNSQVNIQKSMLENSYNIKDVKNIYKYWQVRDEIKNENIKPVTKQMLLENGEEKSTISKSDNEFDYAIITALEENEMEKVLSLIEKEGCIKNDVHLYEYGYFKGNKSKKIVYASQHSTGMIDAAILSTELLRFNPKYLIMAGVLGGKPKDTRIGDVIIATRTFTVDKGKLDEIGFHIETESAGIPHTGVQSIRRAKNKITQYLREEDNTRESEINVHFGPIGCVRQVIDLEDWFAENITPIDRKAIALEMESYAVVRSCELANNGKTKALIIKSVMDNTEQKSDDGKPYAAWSSAMTIKYIIENDII